MATELGDAIRQAREAQHLGTRELARQAGIPESTLRDIEGGRVTSPRLATIWPVIRVLGLEPSWGQDREVGHVDLPSGEVSRVLSLWSRLTPAKRAFALAMLELIDDHAL